MIAAVFFAALRPAALVEPPSAVPEPVAADPVAAASAATSPTGAPTEVPPPPPAAKPTAPPAPRGPKAVPTEAAIARDSTFQPGPARRVQRGRGSARPGTPQRFEFEFKIGPYLPEVDKRYSGDGLGPYATIFGRTNRDGLATKQPRSGVMPILGFEWQFAYLGGPLGIGTQIGFFRDRADALVADPVPGENLRSSADRVSFGMVPLAVLAVYRLELFADFYKVPLVPYIKAGISYAFWWSRDGSKKVAVNSQGEKGRGGVVGWQLNPGLMLRLDFLEPGSAKKLDVNTGINHTYIFGEFQLTRLRNFGVGNTIDLGDKTFFGGLAIEF